MKPALLFLHGFLGRGSDWREFAEPFAPTHLCLLPDLPGHGGNLSADFHARLSFDVLCDDLLRQLDTHGVERAILIGYSMGGRAALYFAVRYPQRVQALVVEGASPGLRDPQERAARSTEDYRRAEQIRTMGMDAFLEYWYALPLFSTLNNYPGKLAALKRIRRLNNPLWMAKVIYELSPGVQPHLWDSLSHLTMPVTLVSGALDAKYSALAQCLALQLPNARVALVPNAGHNAHLENPAAFASVLQAALNSQSTR